MSEFFSPSYRLGSVQPNARVPLSDVNAPIGAFGGNSGAQLQQAGQNLQQGANELDLLARREKQQADETRVEQELNGYIEAKQKALYLNPDSLMRQQGQNAIDAGPKVLQGLDDLRTQALSRMANDNQRRLLKSRLDGQYSDAMGLVGRHTNSEFQQLQVATAKGRGALISNEAALNWNDTEKLDGLAMAAEGVAKETARLQGYTGTDAEKAAIADARSGVYGAAIQQRLDNNQPRQALALYDKVKGQLSAKVNDALAVRMKATQTDIAADDLIARYTPNTDRDSVRQFFEAKGYGKEAAAVMAGNFQWESGFNPTQIHDGGRGFGIAGWDPARTQALKQFAAENKMDPNARQTQLEFSAWELEHNEKGAGDKLKSAKTLDEANKAALDYFRPMGWTAQNPAGGHGYEGRLNNAKAAYEQGGVGFDKANVKMVVDRIMNSDEPLNVRQAAAAKIEKQSSLAESARSATIKGLDNQFEATTQAIMLTPQAVPKGTLAKIAQGYEDAGDTAKAQNVRYLASIEGQFYDFATAPKTTQEVMHSMLSGRAKELAAIAMKGNGDALKMADAGFEGLKTAAQSGINLETMKAKADEAIKYALAAGNPNKAQEISDFYGAHVRAQQAGKQNPAAIEATLREWKQQIENGHNDNRSLQAYKALGDTYKKQQESFDQDAFKTGVDKYGFQVQPMNWQGDIAKQLADRQAIAQQISSNEGNRTVLPFSQAEVADLRNRLEQGNAQQQEAIMRSLAVMPAAAIPHVAAALAGGKEATVLSRSYAAAVNFFANPDPQVQATGRLVLDGAQRIKESGDGERKLSFQSDAVQSALNDKIGNAFISMGGKAPALVADAIHSAYVSLAVRANKQNDKTPDPDLLNQAIEAVVGKPITVNGQMMIPPHGADEYQTRNAIRSIDETDLGMMPLKTLNGSPVTADKIKRYGIFTNAPANMGGGDGRYFVQIPDPANGNQPGYVMGAHGKPLIIDLAPMVERAKQSPNEVAPAPGQVRITPLMQPTDYSGGRK
jgi:Phage tail lysozyme